MIATVLGHLLRCLYYRRGQCVSGGRCKASWIADAFGVDGRNVKAARAELFAAGWLIPVAASQIALNRWGRAVVLALDHDFAGRDSRAACVQSPPPPARSATGSPPPKIHKELPAGTSHQQLCSGVSPKSPPDLRHVTAADLRDPLRLDALHRQAVAAGWLTCAPADRLRFFAAAVRASELATANAPGFFVHLVRRRLWHHVTHAQEDTARHVLRRLDEAPPAGPAAPAIHALVAQVLAARAA